MYEAPTNIYTRPEEALLEGIMLLNSRPGHNAVTSPKCVTVGAQDNELTAKMTDGDIDGLAGQNSYLRDALEACRKQISELTQQVRQSCWVISPRQVTWHDAPSTLFTLIDAMKQAKEQGFPESASGLLQRPSA